MLGKPAPDFSLPSTGGGTFKLSSTRGSRLVPLISIRRTTRAFPFELLSDADETACKLFGVIKMKNMYGKKVRGIERSTFVIDEIAKGGARMARGESAGPRPGGIELC